MTTADMFDWLNDREYDVDKIPSDLFDKMKSEIDEIESDILTEEMNGTCLEVSLRFHKQLKKFKKIS